jgi:hypothetical protein
MKEQICFVLLLIIISQPLTCTVESEKDSADIYISAESFYYANNQRYTITGELPLKESDIRPWNFGIFLGVTTGFMVGQHIVQVNTIWDEKAEFKFLEDGEYALWADKAGHFFGTFLTSYVFKEGFLQAGLSYETSMILGSLMGLSYTTYVEIMDGYGAKWGFSPSDMYLNIAGAAFHIGQYYVPFLQNFTPKFMYFPAPWHGDRHRVPSDMFIDDYSSHTLWLSVNVHNLLPDNLQNYWPPWLELSFGYAVRNLCSPGFNCDPNISDPVSDIAWGNQKYIIALDYNLVQLLPDGPNFWNWFRQSLNYFKLPSPAVEFGSGEARFYLIYPFKL